MSQYQQVVANELESDRDRNNRKTQMRLRIRIPKTNYQEPVISNLISQYHLDINILAAFLGVEARDDGWFDLQLNGEAEQINSALIYLSDLDVEIWRESDLYRDSW
jgi:ABC-type methionine transport system ATPase subunit